jgi:hypothetical protein
MPAMSSSPHSYWLIRHANRIAKSHDIYMLYNQFVMDAPFKNGSRFCNGFAILKIINKYSHINKNTNIEILAIILHVVTFIVKYVYPTQLSIPKKSFQDCFHQINIEIFHTLISLPDDWIDSKLGMFLAMMHRTKWMIETNIYKELMEVACHPSRLHQI